MAAFVYNKSAFALESVSHFPFLRLPNPWFTDHSYLSHNENAIILLFNTRPSGISSSHSVPMKERKKERTKARDNIRNVNPVRRSRMTVVPVPRPMGDWEGEFIPIRCGIERIYPPHTPPTN